MGGAARIGVDVPGVVRVAGGYAGKTEIDRIWWRHRNE